MPRRNLLSLVLITVVSLLCYQKASTFHGEQGRLVDTFSRVMDEINDKYIEPVERRELFEASLAGMMSRLDDNSDYIPPERYLQFNQLLEQRFEGIGIHVAEDHKTKLLTIVSPLVGTPAFLAGLRAGDEIHVIEGHSTEGMTTEQAAKLIRGPVGTPVRMVVRSVGADVAREVVVMRAEIRTPSVLGDRYQADGSWDFRIEGHPHIGLIRVHAFGDDTAQEVETAVKWLQARGMRGLVLDMRGNPGGKLDASVGICDLFIEQGKIVTTRSRAEPERTYFAKREGTCSGFDIAVLIDGGSASASEIVAACLQDYGRAKVFGTRSFGKGSVQSVIPLENGISALKLTIATYWRPNNQNIHRGRNATEKDAWGVIPDVAVPLEGAELEKHLKARRERDIFRSQATPPGGTDHIDPQLRKAMEWLEQSTTSGTRI